ncbi:RNA polymerase sigma factor [Belliella marina]|uniref:RNA polymerase sigma factor n=1 Tax=Belliella marina TaxID=1644146 RepID=A0ABW4VTM5_9BACT
MKTTPLFIHQIQQGNPRAFEELFDTYWEDLVNYGYKLLEDRQASEDIVQELFLEIWDKHENFHITNSLDVFLFSCIKKKILRIFRDQGIRKKHIESLYRLTSKSESPIKELLHDELMGSIIKTLGHLPNKEKEVYILHEIQGYSVKEISNIFTVSEQTVRNQIASASKKIGSAVIKLLIP